MACMKFQKNISTLASVLIICAAFMFNGCASMQSSHYPNLKQTDINVYWPWYRVKNASYFGKLTLAERQRVDEVYAAYKTAWNEAVQAAGGNLNAPTPDNVKDLANEVINVTSAIQISP